MNQGFGTNLQGYTIDGNLSLNKAPQPAIDGDGSLEASGTLYVDTIREYSQTGGVTIQDVIFQNHQITIPYTQPSIGLTTASLLLDGGIYIRSTTNATSLTSGGGCTLLGGLSISKDVHIGGIANIYNNNIINVAEPINDSDAATKYYVDNKTYGNLVGDFSAGQVLIGGTDGNVVGYDSLIFDNQNLITTMPLIIDNTAIGTNLTSGALIVYGGGYFGDYTTVNGILNMTSNNIVNLAEPINDSDAVTKYYVDNKTYGNVSGNVSAGQVLVGDTGGNVTGYNSFLFDNQNLTITTPVILGNTEQGTSITNGALIVYGGGFFGDYTTIDGILNMTSNNIINVADPINDSDVATKKYVDDYGINDNFTTGQIIIGESDGFDVRGYDNLTFNIPDGTHGNVILNEDTSITINNTAEALGLGSGGSVNIAGGVSILGKTYMGDELDMNLKNIKNVLDPVNNFDAVNKQYVDGLFSFNYLELDNNVLTPTDIPDFVFDSDIRAFISYIYIYSYNDCSMVTVRGINRGTSWYIQKTFVGSPNTNVDFYINELGNIQYTNTNTSGFFNIRWTTLTTIYDVPDIDQIDVTLSNNVLVPTDITELTFDNSVYDAVKIIMYISNDSQSNYGMVFLNCLLKDNDWILSPYSFGNVSGINFSIHSSGTNGVIRYTNTNISGTWIVKCEFVNVLKTESENTLLANTNSYTTLLSFENSQHVFNLTGYVRMPDNNKYTLYELEGLYCSGVWSMNSRFIGDILDIHFRMITINNIGYLQYINPTPYDAFIKNILNTITAFDALPVNKGGSGTSFLYPNGILRGNGTDSILSSPDFIYNNYILELGNISSILLNNTNNATGYTTGGTFSDLGGGCFGKDLYIGQDIYIQNSIKVNDIDITPSVGDLTKERTFFGLDNVTQQPITEFIFNESSIKSFNGTLCITITTNPNIYDALYTVKTLKKSTGWIINYSIIGDSLGITLDINASGQILYTSPPFVNWISTEMHFRGLTTTI